MSKASDYITINPEGAELRIVHNLLLSGVAPRPIAFVSSISEDGINNLAPFSYFNAFGANPPYVAFSPAFSGKDGSAKDTLENVKRVPECVVQVVTYDMVEQANLASTTYPKEVDEFIKSGLTPIDSVMVKPKRVKESPFQMECQVEKIIPLGGGKGSGNLVLCKVAMFHVREDIYHDNIINPQDIDLVGRNSANFYTRASHEAIFEVKKPTDLGIGMDQLPEHIRHSRILTANQLARLAGLPNLPSEQEMEAFISPAHKLNANNPYNRKLKQAISQSDHKEEAITRAAQAAIEAGDLHFALKALMTIPLLRTV